MMEKQTLVRRRGDFEEKFDDSKLGVSEEKWKKFLEKYPRDKLSELEIDDYVEGKRKESFCWWLEHGTRKLGSMWGGSAEKFGIYYKKEQGRYWFDKSRFRDEKEAFSKVKEDILKLLDFAERGEFEKVDREINTIWPVMKSKIISMYFPGKIVNVHSRRNIKKISNRLGVEYTGPIKTSAEILTELKNSGVFDDWKEKLTAFQFDQKLGNFVWKKVLNENEPVEERKPPKVWLEKTLVSGRPDRESGPYALGEALWSPQTDKRGADIYGNMRKLSIGDQVLHLVDNDQIIGISKVKSDLITDFHCLPRTEWDDGTGKRPGYLRELEDFKRFDNPIHTYSQILKNDKYKELLKNLLNGGHDLFYTSDLKLREGAYLTEVPGELMRILSEESEKPTIAIQPLDLQPTLIKTKLKLTPDVLGQVCASLNASSHVIITGPVGTGKTSLAEDICRAATENKFCYGYVLTTATSDWTTFDTIGGYMPIEEGKLKFEEGKFLDAIRRNKWLVIDEINRADIDKAFGQLFTVLSGQRVELPFKHFNGKGISIETTNEEKSYFEEIATYKVGRNWRIIATMNVYDMNFLFEMSYAFMRRFAFVYLNVPEPEEFRNLISEWCKGKGISDKTTEKLEKLTEFKERKIGPAIIKDMINYIKHRGEGETQLAEATIAYILPQLEGIEKERIENAWKYIGNIFDEKDTPNKVIRPILNEMTGLELKEITE